MQWGYSLTPQCKYDAWLWQAAFIWIWKQAPSRHYAYDDSGTMIVPIISFFKVRKRDLPMGDSS